MNRLEFAKIFTTNLEKEREYLKLTQSQMADKLELSTSGYKKMVLGETTKIDLYTMWLIHKITGKWLYEMLNSNDKIYGIMTKLRKLTDGELDNIERMLDFKLEQKRAVEENKSDITIPLFIPVNNIEDGMLYTGSNVESTIIPKHYINIADCGIQITSNHLHPVYNRGDILLICQKAPRDGDIGIFYNNKSNRIYIRKFYQTNPCRLEPINGYGKTFYVDSDNKEDMDQWYKFGYVVGKI